jgi:hypothetical protein
MTKLNDVAKKIPAWVGNAILLSYASPEVKAAVAKAAEIEHKREMERLNAEAMGLTVEQYRFVNAHPQLVDWSKVGIVSKNKDNLTQEAE